MSQPTSFASMAMRSFPLMFGAIVFIVGAAIVLAGLAAGATERRLLRNGVVTTGTVIDKRIEEVRRSKKGGGTEQRTLHIVVYRFTTRSGSTADGEQAVSEPTWQRLAVGASAPIRYLETDSSMNRLDAEPRDAGVEGLVAIGGLFSLAGSVSLFIGVKTARQALTLLRSGTACLATITTIENRTIRGRTSYTVRYTYTDAAGHEHTGASYRLTETEANAWKAGDPATIRIDPDRPGRSVWVGSEV